MIESSLSTVLRERASLQPNDTALTFIDYDQDWDGVAQSPTWSQLYRRALNIANEVRHCTSIGDRAAILAPQGLGYIDAFLGALQAGLIAVPLSVPMGGASDERVSSVLRDASPTVLFTTSAVVDNVTEYAQPQDGRPAPSIVEVDLLGLDSQRRSSSVPRSDSGARSRAADDERPNPLYLQFTSGSTRQPAGVMISNTNLKTNFEQLMADYFAEYEGVPPPGTNSVSWLPFYHDMGLVLGICGPILAGIDTVLTSPVAFLQRPARWMQLLATNSHAFSAAPNFALELATRKTSDEDMAGLDLGNVLSIVNGSERVHPATLQRFTERFARFNLDAKALRPSYGLAEAVVYVATRTPAQPPEIVHFESEKLTDGHAKRSANGGGTALVSYGVPQAVLVRIVDAETCIECPAGTVGEIWVHGDNVAEGYWQKPDATERTFGGTLVTPSAGTPEGPWLRTGDSGFVSDGELFILGRIKDLLIVYGRNHSPDDIEATIQEITGGRCVAIAAPADGVEKLVVIIELKKRGDSEEDAMRRLDEVKREVIYAISTSHGLSVSDLVVASPGSIPITTSGKVRRAECVELYRQNQFTRLDA